MSAPVPPCHVLFIRMQGSVPYDAMTGSLGCQRRFESKVEYDRWGEWWWWFWSRRKFRWGNWLLRPWWWWVSWRGWRRGDARGDDVRLWLMVLNLKVDFPSSTNNFVILMMERFRLKRTPTSHISKGYKSDEDERQIQITCRIQIIFRSHVFFPNQFKSVSMAAMTAFHELYRKQAFYGWV